MTHPEVSLQQKDGPFIDIELVLPRGSPHHRVHCRFSDLQQNNNATKQACTDLLVALKGFP